MFRSLITLLLRVCCRLLFRVSVRGDSNAFAAERLLVVANHESFLDGLLLGLFLPLRPVFVVHTVVAKNRFFRLVLSLVDYLAVDPTNPIAMKKVVRLLESGRPVVIFPEGRITTTGSLMKVYDGPAFVAAKTGATILPVRLDGASRSYFSRLSGKNRKSFFPKIHITVLPVTHIPMPEATTAKLRRKMAGEAMRRLMQEMIFASRPSQTLYTALCDAAEIFGGTRRVLEDIRQVEYSYKDLLKITLALSRQVERISAEHERIGLLLPNMASTLGLLLGLSARRRVPAMLNYTAGMDAMQAACTAAEVRLVLTARAFVEQTKIADKLSGLRGIELVYLEDLIEQIRLPDKIWLWAYALRFPRTFALPSSPEDPAVILFTSGSEGQPKGVVLSHRAILSNIAQVRAVIDFSVDDKVLNAMPIFHSFGLTAGTLMPVLTGAGLFLYPNPLHYRIIPELVYDRNCTVLFGTSTFLNNYAQSAHPYDFYRLRYVVAGAEKLTETVRNLWFEKFGIRIFEGYGATETAPVLAVNTPMAYRTGTVGTFLPGIEAKVLPVPGVEHGGLLHVRGPNLMSGYLKADRPGVVQAPASELGAGWYATGDVVDVDAEGFVSILGRLKRFAKIGGEMVSLEVVEKLASAVSPEHSHGALALPDASRGEAIVLFTTDAGLTRALLATGAKKLGIPELALPRKVHFLDALPLLGTGKIDYPSLNRQAGELSA
ncbi:MAG: bifunctional acyl-ACP--phospholipid O-acyltransferase/long-chain-fatty-acid--ACP ligase [Desulfobulbus sp.]|uniref:bifunctional acyl-ACP--phospholipid O-acyltransferase/long-chain-fatty-acid--ACP ligase n=1 Tax=Desulfobulbus sp. TaxID=895 RepID=UPI00284C04A6|nr:bifunctional acyl-ACP--phospholipid O-acyltransferase/long-chain-fatty-acid--ACP ligase [Desulfobulbus sp.]MDR2548811.1 bifunctional acyl-ACP--phospholipid O-acyltransferase/long-chain-fatty-acid--ACP ligase [Desulfobulbus sp.]